MPIRLSKKAVNGLNAPVSGGQLGAEQGNLTIMAGGEKNDFQRALPYLETMGEKINLLGGVGAGQITKLANQIIVGIGITALAEAFTLGQSGGSGTGQSSRRDSRWLCRKSTSCRNMVSEWSIKILNRADEQLTS